MNNTHTVHVTETLDRQVEVEADSTQDAIKKVEKQYEDEEIVLDWSDHVDTDIVRG